ncbi:NUMOD4 domain-containing protein [Polaribacter septentrionalilitoris]|uniref:NUMOD4 domain-containing protein n=1 Tax=Polaribacter septentrionalilitoris TaxID=2494657 RepID=UPI00135B665A|nr:NUMOD4 domain-containing protein [Polaribacter septentrionalilitoris]
MIRNLWNEDWKDIQFDEKISEKVKFRISNYGRIIKYSKDKQVLKKKTYINGYETISLRQKLNHKTTSRYVHKLVAQHFLEKENEDQVYVIHLNYDKKDNTVNNLKWATKREKELHQFNNPNWESVVKKRSRNIGKLTEGKVKIIKRQLKNNRTRITMIAKRFGVSDMQIHRIKSGENWSHVKI